MVQVLKGKSVCRGMERSSKHAVHVTLAALGQPQRLCKTRLAVDAFLWRASFLNGVHFTSDADQQLLREGTP